MAGGNERRASGALETEIMTVLQRAGRPLSTSDVQRLLSDDLAYSTVVTILTRMHDKGLLVREKAGRAFHYAPVSDEPGLVARRMHQALQERADRHMVLARFVDTLSDQDERLLRDLLEGRPE
ncbi:BlaI/MecI/CopY family transcriptional regulator [Actinomadura logoneensis]|uniref:BlaI/MecI/CopY family transcriptional regulator n=1 Tax=Actinomadura logoneensis TaxID=2293572 RepID=A0A372JFV7_9ACTN|nr:BlaI/MecI/CopY family transcriptional regulator [Actinomadura logoneensis]RFU38887.1 BlaI/MecI/CopY family transcriptional regulator [Actinomadura logoneensis]